MSIMIKNQPMHGEMSSTNATSGVIVTIFPSGTFTGYDSNDPEFLVITDVILSSAGTGLVTLFCDTTNTPTDVGPGEAIVSATMPANGFITVRFQNPYICARGANLVVIAPSGQASCQVQGFIKSNPNSSTYPSAATAD